MLIMFSLVILILDVLVGVAFLTLLERELLGYFQIREGPYSVGFLGILLPLSDALKLFSEEQSIPLMPNYWIYYFSPIFNLTLSLFLWMIMPFWLGFSSFSISISFIIICIKHPLSQGFLILMYTTLISLTSGLFSSFWYSHIVFLIFIGGLLLLFIYMTSISSNEKFKTNIFLFLKMSKIFSSTMVYSNVPNSFLNEYLIKNMLNNQMKYLNDLYSMSKFLFSPHLNFLLLQFYFF